MILKVTNDNTDRFARWRLRKAPTPASTASTSHPNAGAVAATAPVGPTYSTIFMSRGWALLLTVLWLPCALAMIVLFLSDDANWSGIPYETGLRVATFFLIAFSLVLPMLLCTSRREWQVHADHVAIRYRPLIPLLGPYRLYELPYGEIAFARKGEMLNGLPILEIESRGGIRHRLPPRHIGQGKAVHSDLAGFEAFIEQLRSAIAQAGIALPPGEELRTFTSGLVGIIVLGAITLFFAALSLMGVYIAIPIGEPAGVELLAFVAPFALLFGGLLADRWRKWLATRDG